MRVVIQCAGKKIANAGSLRTSDGRRVRFVAHPELVSDSTEVYAHPDDVSDDGPTWRERLFSYNQEPGSNPLGLRRAIDLYQPAAYRALAERFGVEKLYILSAGWGLIPGGFLTPDYNVTFSSSGEPIVRRSPKDTFHDWAMIDPNDDDPLIFLGGKSYLPHFCRLTEHYGGPRIALYNSKDAPSSPGVRLERYETPRRTNWHYGAAEALARGVLRLP